MKMSERIHKLVKAGHKPKDAISSSLAAAYKAKKMADGGMVEEGDYDLDEEHERGLFDLMKQGDQSPVMNPEVQSEEKKLAMMLMKHDEAMEYSMGGLVQDGPAGDEPVGTKPSENMASHIEDVHVKPMSLTEEAIKALEMKKKKRRFK